MSKLVLVLSQEHCEELVEKHKLSEPQIRFLHKRFLQLDRGCDGFIGTKDLLTDEKFTHFNPWFITFVENLLRGLTKDTSNLDGFLALASRFLHGMKPSTPVEDRLKIFLSVLCALPGQAPVEIVTADGLLKLINTINTSRHVAAKQNSALTLVRAAAGDQTAHSVQTDQLAKYLVPRIPDVEILLNFDLDVETAEEAPWAGVTQADQKLQRAATRIQALARGRTVRRKR